MEEECGPPGLEGEGTLSNATTPVPTPFASSAPNVSKPVPFTG